MPFMKQWVTINLDEDLLVQVVRELLNMAVDPNHVEVIHVESGRAVLVEAHLAEHWYQERQKDDVVVVDSEVIDAATTTEGAVVESSEVAASSNLAVTEIREVAASSNQTELPVKRGPGRPRNAPPPSASPDGEEL